MMNEGEVGGGMSRGVRGEGGEGGAGRGQGEGDAPCEKNSRNMKVWYDSE
jgi:hypothetical protein